MTSSFSPIPNANNAKCNATVPLVTVWEKLIPVYFENSFSNWFINLPFEEIHVDVNASLT